MRVNFLILYLNGQKLIVPKERKSLTFKELIGPTMDGKWFRFNGYVNGDPTYTEVPESFELTKRSNAALMKEVYLLND